MLSYKVHYSQHGQEFSFQSIAQLESPNPTGEWKTPFGAYRKTYVY